MFPTYPRLKWLAVPLISTVFLWLVILRKPPQGQLKKNLPYLGPDEALLEDGIEGFLPLAEARDFCKRRRWEPYGTRSRRRKVYDMFLINTELDFLEIRLNELDRQVDYFVVLESPTTFQMRSKPLHLKDNLHLPQFKDFQHKLIHHVLSDSDAKKALEDSTWAHERFTRNALFDEVLLSQTGEKAPQQGDVLLVGDIDEIPRVETLTVLRNCAFPPRVTLRTQIYYYSFQWLHRGPLWHHPQATFFNGPEDTIRPESLRVNEPDVEIYMSGWHCSSCFATMSDLQTKISSFSHSGYNEPYYLDPARLVDRIRNGKDMFERPEQIYDRIDNNSDIPSYLRSDENRNRFAYLLDRDPPNANFRDVGIS